MTILEYPVGFPFDITAGPDGAMWFTNLTSIGRIATTGDVTLFPLPSPNRLAVRIAAGRDGALWFTEQSTAHGSPAIGRVSTDGHITEYPLPMSAAGIRGIAAGPDGALWYTEWTGDAIGRMTVDGLVTEYALGHRASTDWITVGPDGALWFTEANTVAGTIGRITTDGVITEFDVPHTGTGITSGPDGALWITEWTGRSVMRITTTGAVTVHDLAACWSDRICADGITAGDDGAFGSPCSTPTPSDDSRLPATSPSIRYRRRTARAAGSPAGRTAQSGSRNTRQERSEE